MSNRNSITARVSFIWLSLLLVFSCSCLIKLTWLDREPASLGVRYISTQIGKNYGYLMLILLFHCGIALILFLPFTDNYSFIACDICLCLWYYKTIFAVRNRMKSVKNIQKITKAMKMVAASKLRAIQSRAENSRGLWQPFTALLGDTPSMSINKPSIFICIFIFYLSSSASLLLISIFNFTC